MLFRSSARAETKASAPETSDAQQWYSEGIGGDNYQPPSSQTALNTVKKQQTDNNKPWTNRMTESMISGEAQRQALLGLGDIPYSLAGLPVDVATTVLRPLGYKTQAPIGGSQWLREKAEALGIREPESADPALRAVRQGADVLGSLFVPVGPSAEIGRSHV